MLMCCDWRENWKTDRSKEESGIREQHAKTPKHSWAKKVPDYDSLHIDDQETSMLAAMNTFFCWIFHTVFCSLSFSPYCQLLRALIKHMGSVCE